MIDYKAILTAGIPDSKYHAATHVLSASGAKKLLACPARFKYERDHPPPEPKRAFDFGRLAHTLVLGEGSEIVVVDADNWTTKAAREQRDAAYAASATPVLRAEYDAALAMRDAVMAHPTASQLFAQGVAELSGFFEDDSTGIGLRFRPDFMTEVNGKPACIDFKTASSADPAEFARSVARYLYHLQNAWYIAGLNAHGIKGAAFYFRLRREDTAVSRQRHPTGRRGGQRRPAADAQSHRPLQAMCGRRRLPGLRHRHPHHQPADVGAHRNGDNHLMDITETCAPRSDQINAEDLLTGPRTVDHRRGRQGNTRSAGQHRHG
jgi:hypothetical protein